MFHDSDDSGADSGDDPYDFPCPPTPPPLPFQEVWAAAQRGRLEPVRKALTFGVGGTDLWHLLRVAAVNDHTHLVLFLIAAQGKFVPINDARTAAGRLLEKAASAGSADVVKHLLTSVFVGEQLVDNGEVQGSTPLQVQGSTPLQVQGSTPLQVQGSTPLVPAVYEHWALIEAAKGGHTSVAKALLAHRGPTLLHYAEGEAEALSAAAHRGHADTVRVLLRAKADARKASLPNGPLPNVPLLRRLLDAGMNPNARFVDNGPFSLLTRALSEPPAVELLLDKGAAIGDTDVLDAMCTSASVQNRVKVVRLLLARKADPNTTGRLSYPCLLAAALRLCVDAVVPLLDAKALVNGADIRGRSVLHYAACDEMCAPDARGWGSAVDALIQANAAVDARDGNGNTALHQAASLEVVQRLLAANADPCSANVGGETPLHMLTKRSLCLDSATGEAVVSQLLAAKADLNATDLRGQTAVHHLALSLYDGEAGVASFLVAAKADLNARTTSGKTPLYLHCSHRLFQMRTSRVATLLGLKADPNCVNARGKPLLLRVVTHAFDRACDRRSSHETAGEVCSLLLAAKADGRTLMSDILLSAPQWGLQLDNIAKIVRGLARASVRHGVFRTGDPASEQRWSRARACVARKDPDRLCCVDTMRDVFDEASRDHFGSPDAP